MDEISRINLETIVILAKEWSDISAERSGEKKRTATAQEIKQFQGLLKGLKDHG